MQPFSAYSAHKGNNLAVICDGKVVSFMTMNFYYNPL